MAAGSSSRMNGIKQLLPWKKSNLLLHVVNTIQLVQKEHIYVVLGANSDIILKETNLASLPLSVIENSNWEKGLGNSISRGVEYLQNLEQSFDGILICLADQPLLDIDYYKQLMHEFKLKKHSIVATKYFKKAGVPAIFSHEIANELRSLDPDSGAKKLLTQYQESIYIFDAGNKIVDIDTPEEYRKLYEQYN